jgi:phytoene dehydrogenase-like protein
VTAVVIGSGPNGLAAAIALAEAGREVTVLEASDRIGGAVATEELTLPGFLHDTFSSVYPATVASPVFARMPLERHGLRWVHPRRCYAHPLPDGRAGALSRDLDETAASLDALHPGDGEAWRRFADPYLRHWGSWRDTMLAGFPPVKGPVKLLAAHRLRGTLDFTRLLLMPAEALAHRMFGAGGSRAWLYGAAMHGDVPPDGAGSAIAAAHLNLMGHAVGWPSPEGGAARLAEALAAHLRELGGTVRAGAPVTRVHVERGRVTGAEVAGEERVPASLVVADVTPGGLLRLAGDALGERYAAELRGFRPGPSTLKVDWALSGAIP